jgi:hypothetical protein
MTEDPRDYGLTAADLRLAADQLYPLADPRFYPLADPRLYPPGDPRPGPLSDDHDTAVRLGRICAGMRSLADALEESSLAEAIEDEQRAEHERRVREST